MRIKSYFSNSVEEAMDKARRELGPEAMLMDSKKTERELRALGAYEVVFAVAPEAVGSTEKQPKRSALQLSLPPATAPAAALLSEARHGASDLARELAELRKQIETVKRSVESRPVAVPPAGRPALSADGAELIARLTAADLSAELAADLASAVENRRSLPGPGGSLDDALRAECASRLRFDPSLAVSAPAPRAVLFAGPAGVGKTTTLVKLALRYGLRGRLPLQLLSLDTLRIGGWEQLASYARIAGIPCEAVHTPAALDQTFAGFGQRKLLFIDTPGLAPADEGQNRGLAAWLAAHRSAVEVQLVLSATVQPRVQLATIERFAAFAPARLLFTHLDEAESPGPLLETALRAGLPVSFLANGQQVPEDIDEASLDRVLGSLASSAPESRLIASAA
jgi:flagellar biosynthesis protein FlhF